MANDNILAKTNAQIVAILDTYIVTADDGSLRVKESELIAYLSEQFGYYTTYGADPTVKDGTALNIVNQLKAVVNKERWTADPAWPRVGSNSSETLRVRLREIQAQTHKEVQSMEAAYVEVSNTLNARVKSIFNSAVAPGYPSGVELIDTTRVYVETFVTDWGEESRPSPASELVTMDQNDTATVTCSAAPAGRNITKRRLYRSATGTASSAFKLQGEYPIATTVITDSKPLEQLNDVCATFGWLEPPAGLKGLTSMPNGIMLGYVGRTLYACEPYHPYAWPSKYDKPLAHQITGIVAVGQSAFVGTTGRPYLVSGSDSASLSEEIISSKVPCLSGPSMVAIRNSVFYSSPDGLALYENGQVSIATKGVIDRKTWRSYNPSTMRAGEFDGMYMAFYTKSNGTKGCIVFDYENKTISELDQAADAVFSDESGIYLLNGSTILDAMPADGANRTGQWFSKTFRLTSPQSFAWIHVDSSFMNGVTPVSATVRIYANGALHHTAVVSSKAPVRNKPGRHSDWRIEIDCAARIDGVVLASTTEELKAAI